MTDYVYFRDDALPGKGQPTDMFPGTQDVRATKLQYNDTMLIFGIFADSPDSVMYTAFCVLPLAGEGIIPE